MIFGFDASRAFTDKKTGTENYSYQLLKALAKIDHKNQYIVYLRPNYSSNNNGWPKNFQFKVIRWPRLWTQGGLAIQTFKDKLDVLFVPSHTLPIIRKPGLKTVVTVHDLGSEYLPGMHQLKQRLYLSVMQRYQLKTSSKIIAVSNATKQDLVKKIGLDPKKIEVIYEGYDKNLYRKLPIDTIVNRLRQYGLKPQEYFLFVGTVQPRKNLARLIEAFAKFSSKYQVASSKGSTQNTHTTGYILHTANLVIAGSKGWLSDGIYALPKKLGIEERVKFLPPEGGRVGYVPDEDLPALYGGAIAFVYPSLFEGFGLPILEAQACGCPVITSNISSMPEVACLPAGKAGKGAILVDPYSMEEIAEGMMEIQRSKIKDQKVRVGLENAKRFSWEKCARETLSLLESSI